MSGDGRPASARQLAELGHALEGFADALRLDRARPDDEDRLRALAARARVLSVRPHARAAELDLAADVPHLVEPDHRATHSTYGHLQLRLDTATAALRGR